MSLNVPINTISKELIKMMMYLLIYFLSIVVISIIDDLVKEKIGPSGFGRKEDVSRGVVILKQNLDVHENE